MVNRRLWLIVLLLFILVPLAHAQEPHFNDDPNPLPPPPTAEQVGGATYGRITPLTGYWWVDYVPESLLCASIPFGTWYIGYDDLEVEIRVADDGDSMNLWYPKGIVPLYRVDDNTFFYGGVLTTYESNGDITKLMEVEFNAYSSTYISGHWTTYHYIAKDNVECTVTADFSMTRVRGTNCADDEVYIPEEECEALLDYYDETAGGWWEENYKWRQDNYPCYWYGVSCEYVNGGYHVTGLHMPDNHVQGAVTVSVLRRLPHLKYLDLSNNSIRMDLKTLGAAPSLVVVNLASNKLTGSIPGAIDQMVNLRELYLYDNELTGELPNSLGYMPKLEVLQLYRNEFYGPIPATLGNLTNLRQLHLHANRLSGPIPATLGNLGKLDDLLLHSNNLRGPIPYDLTYLPPLEQASFAFNALSIDMTAPENEIIGLEHWLATNDFDWYTTQTVPPENLRLETVDGRLRLVWDVIEYTRDIGYYHVFIDAADGGPYPDYLCQTASKLEPYCWLDDLVINTPREIIVYTYTHAHGEQQNSLYSEPSQPLTIRVAASLTDMNGDGYVTPADAIFVQGRIGQPVNESNSMADVDKDGDITELDMQAVIANIGLTNPE